MIEISHHGALPIHRFWPLRTHVSSSRFAVVVRPPPVPEPTSGSVRPKQPISRRPQSRQVKAEKIADAFDHDIGRRQGADTLRIAGILPCRAKTVVTRPPQKRLTAARIRGLSSTST